MTLTAKITKLWPFQVETKLKILNFDLFFSNKREQPSNRVLVSVFLRFQPNQTNIAIDSEDSPHTSYMVKES